MALKDQLHRVASAGFAFLIIGALVACGGGGAAVPGGPKVSHGPVAPVTDNWITYAHDARHTSASQANISGPLRVAWRYDPQPASGNTFSNMYNAAATVHGVYIHWFQSAPTILGAGPSVDGLATSGAHSWTFIAKRDFDEGHWLSVFNSDVVFQDDEAGFIDSASGKLVSQPSKPWPYTYDMWGETIPDASGLYEANTFLADGSDLFVYSLDSTGAARWSALKQTSTKYSQDNLGALVLSNGTLYYAASYTDPSPHASGIYALNESTGSQIAYVAATAVSDMSADANNIYLVESPSNLVARSQSNLHPVWSVSVPSALLAAPVLANGLVIVATYNDVEAHDPNSGKLVWSSPVRSYGYGTLATTLAVALASNTLIVTAIDGVHILNLANGKDIWHGTVAGAQGPVTNPIIVNDSSLGATLYVTDSRGLIALVPG